jgi:hypothetical protein
VGIRDREGIRLSLIVLEKPYGCSAGRAKVSRDRL